MRSFRAPPRARRADCQSYLLAVPGIWVATRRAQGGRVMKTFALALCALLLAVGAVPMALAQDSSNQSPAAAPGAPSPSTDAAPKAPDVKVPDTNLTIDVQTRSETKGS